MAQFYTLEEAAAKLGVSPEEFKRRLREDWKQIRTFRDGSTLQFRANEIDELARTLGGGSEPELKLALDSDPLQLSFEDSDPNPSPPQSKSPKTMAAIDADEPLVFGDNPMGLSFEGDNTGDSFKTMVQIESPSTIPSGLKSSSDSDVRLEKTERIRPPSNDGEDSILTEEISLELPSPSGKLSGKSGKMAKPAEPAKANDDSDSSEFELSLEADSSSEFELSLNDSSDEISLGDMPAPKTGNSGISLSNPADSGVSLEKNKKQKPKLGSSEEIDFELSLDPSSSSKKMNQVDSDSEFELTLDDDNAGASFDAETSSFSTDEQKDIFETDFEIPSMDQDSGSAEIAIEDSDTDLESSDFDLAMDSSDDESGSEVVVVDDEDESSAGGRRKLKPLSKRGKGKVEDTGDVSFDEMDLEEESASKALRGARRPRVDEDELEDMDDDDDVRPAGRAVEQSWGFWGVLMIPCVLLMFVGAIMGYELLNGLWGYNTGNRPSAMLIDNISDMFGMKPKE